MTLENKRALLLYCVKPCASFQSHGWIQIGVTVQKCSIWVKISDFFVPCDLEIQWMTLKNNSAHFLYYIKLFAWFQSYLLIQTLVTVWKHFIRVKIGNFLVLCDLEIWRMTLNNNKALLLCCFKLGASFQSRQWIKTGDTVQKLPICVKIGDFLYSVTMKFYRWPWKTIGYLFYATSSFVHHVITIVEFKLKLPSGNAQLG